MKIYLVGGAVRDLLMGINSQDLDYVVVGSSIQEMLSLGYIPVGKDFPVFLHPITKHEYALARTERKVSQGYQGFNFYTDSNITLEQDLLRRDLTINAMALPVDEYHQSLSLEYLINFLIDPFNGKQDLENKLLRHVSPAFSEDPVRILRIARFSARYNFRIASDTLILMQNMVNNGEVNALVAERIWQEITKGLSEKYPQNLLQALHDCNALTIILPDFIYEFEQHINFLKQISNINNNLNLENNIDSEKIFLCMLLYIDLSRNIDISAICKKLKVSKELIDISKVITKIYTQVLHLVLDKTSLSYTNVLDIFISGDAIRRQDRFNYILDTCNTYAKYYHNIDLNPQISYIQECLDICINISTDDITNAVENAKKFNLEIKMALNKLRLDVLLSKKI